MWPFSERIPGNKVLIWKMNSFLIFWILQILSILDHCVKNVQMQSHAVRGLRGSWLHFWISWENINHYLKRSFPLMISSVNVTKSPDIYWRNPSWKTSFFVQFNYSLIQALIKIIVPIQLEGVFRGINKCNKSF